MNLAKEYKNHGHKIYILSNMCVEIVNILKTLFDFSMFDGVIFSCDLGKRKPDLSFYKEAIKKWNIKTEESLFIDDNIKNLIPFESLGGKVYFFNSKNEYKKDLNKIISTCDEIKN